MKEDTPCLNIRCTGRWPLPAAPALCWSQQPWLSLAHTHPEGRSLFSTSTPSGAPSVPCPAKHKPGVYLKMLRFTVYLPSRVVNPEACLAGTHADAVYLSTRDNQNSFQRRRGGHKADQHGGGRRGSELAAGLCRQEHMQAPAVMCAIVCSADSAPLRAPFQTHPARGDTVIILAQSQ